MTLVTARFAQQGIHCWPDAPDRRAYLRDPHRHLFAVEVTVATGEADNRPVEFHDLADRARAIMAGLGRPYHPGAGDLLDFGATSCERLAQLVTAGLQGIGLEPVRVVVSEDGESDGIWER